MPDRVPRSMARRRRLSLLTLAAVLVSLGNGECENVETCTPTEAELRRVDAAYEVSLVSGELPLRNRLVRVQAVGRSDVTFTAEVELDDDGRARVEVPAGALAGAGEVIVSFPGDRNFCPAGAGTDDGTGA